jgi:hypothetical protein
VRQVVALQFFQQRHLDFGLLGNRRKGNLLSFTLLAQPGAETIGHAEIPGARCDSTEKLDRLQAKSAVPGDPDHTNISQKRQIRAADQLSFRPPGEAEQYQLPDGPID